MKNIFEMNLEEIDKKLDEIFKETTPEKLVEELKECGYKEEEIINIEKEVNSHIYVKEVEEKYKNIYKEFLHKNRTRRLATFEEKMEVA